MRWKLKPIVSQRAAHTIAALTCTTVTLALAAAASAVRRRRNRTEGGLTAELRLPR
jgi:hypothetical protein